MKQHYITPVSKHLQKFLFFVVLSLFTVFNAQAQTPSEDDEYAVKIKVVDTTVPTISAPSPIDLEGCSTGQLTAGSIAHYDYSATEVTVDLATFNGFTDYSAADAANNIDTVTYIDTVSGTDPNITVTRTWTVTDTCGNTSSTTQEITITNSLSVVTTTVTQPNCFGETGTIDITASGGSPIIGGYTYSWVKDTGATEYSTSEDLNNLEPGSYQVTVTDVNGCTVSLSDPVIINAAPNVINATETTSAHQDVTCNGVTDGAFTVVATGGAGTPYTYSLAADFSNSNTTGEFTGLIAGDYTVYVKDANGCEDPSPIVVTIQQPDALTAVVSGTSTICSGSTATITVELSGGTQPWAVTLLGQTSATSVTDTDSTDDNSFSYTYTTEALISDTTFDSSNITVTDANNCSSTITGSAVVTVNALPEISGDSQVCIGSNITLSITGTGGTWTSSNTAVATVNNSGVVSGLTSGTVQITHTDANGCESANYEVTVYNCELSITKVANPTSITTPGVINYTITVVNTGNADLTNIDVTDPFAGGATYSSGDTADTGVLNVGETWVYTASYTATQAVIDAGADLVNTASIVTSEISQQDANATTVIKQSPALTVNKTVDQAAISSPGTLNYTIEVSNTGNTSLTNIVVDDTFVTIGPTLTGGDTNNDNILDVGETWIYTATKIVTQVMIDAGTDLVNTASVTSTEVATAVVDDATTIVEQKPSWTVTKEAAESTYTAVGNTLNYTITVVNTGNVSITGVTVSDLGADATPGVVRGSDLVGNDDATLEVGESWTYTAVHTITQADIDAGSFTNTATATAMPSGGTLDEATGSATVDATQTLSVSSVTVTEGADLEFVISLTGSSTTDIIFTPSIAHVTTSGSDITTPIQYSIDGGATWITWTSGDITIPSGVTNVLFNIPTVDDNIVEPTETLTLTASVTSNNTSNGSAQGVGTITDNDALTVSIAAISVTEGDVNTTENFVATLSGVAEEDVVLTFTTTAGTATDGSDYTGQSTVSYTIIAGTTSVNIPVEIIG
ncbi:beta strand repeat-containing protein, partial [Bizionia paragorgiae]